MKNINFENFKPIEILTLIVSFIAMWLSWNAQDYVEATYSNNQKIIIFSEKDKNLEGVSKISAVGENKRILSVEIIYPDKFRKEKDYIDSRGMYQNDLQIIKELTSILPENITNGEHSASIPVRLVTRYAVDGDSYSDVSNYVMTFYFSIKKDKENQSYELAVHETQFVFSSRRPNSVIYFIISYFFGEDETQDINDMFNKKVFWNTINFAGKL
ncbi:hypothetical protein [Pectobacterium aroidearum]|uniref:hypothetical protein n=1 Tax=Pectobacterium aroidearum TaxID=1201031 RepID=UPI002A7F44A9|nr:hypothetical protein [Pectobacterium aroidearum]MDY4386417.1 hypothetical protein [Pectobacterium aroidearum]